MYDILYDRNRNHEVAEKSALALKSGMDSDWNPMQYVEFQIQRQIHHEEMREKEEEKKLWLLKQKQWQE